MGTPLEEDEEHVTVEVDDRGRITIPVALRDRLGILPGDELAIELDEGRLVVRPEQADLLTVTSGKDDWETEAFPDSGEATFGGHTRDDE
jgi:AbrB family looped-hinge helix DNA binding protein